MSTPRSLAHAGRKSPPCYSRRLHNWLSGCRKKMGKHSLGETGKIRRYHQGNFKDAERLTNHPTVSLEMINFARKKKENENAKALSVVMILNGFSLALGCCGWLWPFAAVGCHLRYFRVSYSPATENRRTREFISSVVVLHSITRRLCVYIVARCIRLYVVIWIR